MTSRIFLHGRACGFNDRVVETAYLCAMFFTTAPTTRVGRRAVHSHSTHFNIIKKRWVSEEALRTGLCYSAEFDRFVVVDKMTAM